MLQINIPRYSCLYHSLIQLITVQELNGLSIDADIKVSRSIGQKQNRVLQQWKLLALTFIDEYH